MPEKADSSIYVALLRGVNVGGNALISMKALAASFERFGFRDVRTYINSGNVLFRTNETDPRKLEQTIEALLVSEHKLTSKVIVRSFKDIERLITRWPRGWDDDREWKCNVIFLSHAIDSKDILAGFKLKDEIEKVVYLPGTLLWSALTSAIGRTAMMKMGKSAMYQQVTVRNPNTTRKLYELMKQMRDGQGCAAR